MRQKQIRTLEGCQKGRVGEPGVEQRSNPMVDPLIQCAALAIAEADALLIGAGAGMGVDSGLPDFRGDQGFWNAYPPYAKLGLSFSDLASPRWFRHDPELAWGFYGHRLHLYRAAVPHTGFAILRAWSERMRLGAFVFTSNVDGQFQRAGFDPERIGECHGSIHWMQCLADCGAAVFSADNAQLTVDVDTFRSKSPLPVCPSCGALARPNILMFGDGQWDGARTSSQDRLLRAWLHRLNGARVAVVECGAGTAIPSVRFFCENVVDLTKGKLIRINPRESDVPPGHIGLAMGARAGLEAIQQCLEGAPQGKEPPTTCR